MTYHDDMQARVVQTYPRKVTLREGFSLIDTLLGVGMFLIVTVALIQFTLTTLRAADNLSQQIAAQNIAREGIEIMENIRGTNAMSFVSWSTAKTDHPYRELADLLNFGNFASSGEVCLTVEPKEIGSTSKSPWRITPLASCPKAEDPTLPAETKLYENTLSGGSFFTHQSAGASTELFRYIKLTKSAKSSFSDLSSLLTNFQYTREEQHSDDDIVLVESVVRWSERDDSAELRLHKVLADWYQ